MTQLSEYIAEQFDQACAHSRDSLLGDLAAACASGELDEHYRHVVRDTELSGVALRGGSRLLLAWGAANRDPAHFDHPDQFRLDRPTGKGHLAFGKGAHFCVGAALARLEATVVLRQLLERTTVVEVVEACHWLPSLLVRRLDHLELALI